MRRRDDQYHLLREHLQLSLCCIYELQSYGLYLQSSPAIFSCLLHEALDESTVSRVLRYLKEEWQLVLKMERQEDTRRILHSMCPHVHHQSFRELHLALSRSSYNLTENFLELVGAWYPKFTGSANIEQVFQAMERSIRQSGCSNTASLTSLMSVGVRCTAKRLCTDERSPSTITLSADDFEGPEIRALKDRMWRPASASNSASIL